MTKSITCLTQSFTLLFTAHRSDYSRIAKKLSQLKGECSVFKKNIYILDENDALSKYKKIPLGHNRTNRTVYSKLDFKVEICSAH